MSAPLRIALTLGDPSGIGPEITVRALADGRLPPHVIPVVYGGEAAWVRACAITGLPDTLERIASADEARRPSLLVCDDTDVDSLPLGQATDSGGVAQLRYLEHAANDVVLGDVSGLVTAPVNKAAIMRTGLSFRGHTEYLQERFGVPRVVMLMAGPHLRVALATTHVALSRVPTELTVDGLAEVIRLTARELESRFGIAQPRLAVLGLNPHAGEDGKFGDEEARIVTPALEQARAGGIRADGPFAADGFFARYESLGYDAVVALYHDQGLIPFKMIDGIDGVNVTLGLPRPRTSPDHGVAYDIAGKGIADHRSMAAALDLCVRLAG